MNKKVLAAVVLAAITTVYLGGRFYFKNHFYPRTTINSVKCSLKTDEEAIQKTADFLDEYALIIHDDVTDMIVTASDAGLRYDNTSEITKLLEAQDEAVWFKQMFKKHAYKAMSTSLEEEKLIEYINQLECMNPAEPQKPVSAKLGYDEATKSYQLTDEIIGNTVDTDLFYPAVIDAVLACEPKIDLSTTEYYKQPKYKVADDLVQEAKATVDKYMSTVIHYEDADLKYEVNKDQIHNFLKISKDFKIDFEYDVMKEFIKGDMSKIFNTVGSTRKLTSPGSGDIVIAGGNFGWQVSLLMERDKMIGDILDGKEVTRKPEYIQDGKQRKKDNDIGDSYVDVSIDQQTLWVVEKGQVTLTTPFVSGNASQGHDTDKGVYSIEYKTTDYLMRDYDVTVKYWLPFNTDVGEGFHDALWRGSFGGNIYLHNGSHGCVNLPYEMAKKMYEILPVGFPVIVH